MTPAGRRTPLPPGKQWVPHNGNRECLRRMQQSLRRIEKLRDEASVAALARLHAALTDDPDPAAGVLNLAHSALLAADGVGCTWADAVNHLLDRFEERAHAEA